MPIIVEPLVAFPIPLSQPAPSGAGFEGGEPGSSPRGLESVVIYNGLTMNDGQYADRYTISEIGGVTEDPDVRDSREENPADHGEIPFDSLYGGRTVSLQGRLDAGNLDKMRQMQQAMKTSFGPLQESPLYFKFWDVRDDFSKDTLANYKYIAGSGLTNVGGHLTFSDITTKKVIHTLRQYKSYRAILKFKTPPTIETTQLVEIIGKFPASLASQNVRFLWNGASSRLEFWEFAGVNENLGNTTTNSAVLLPNTYYWLSLSQRETRLVGELWKEEPSDYALPFLDITRSLSSTGTVDGVALFGDTQRGYAGFRVIPGTQLGWELDEFSITGINPSDAHIFCKKSVPIASKEVQDTPYYRRNFFVTLRASNPRIFSPHVARNEIIPTQSTPIAIDEDFGTPTAAPSYALHNKALAGVGNWSTVGPGTDFTVLRVTPSGDQYVYKASTPTTESMSILPAVYTDCLVKCDVKIGDWLSGFQQGITFRYTANNQRAYAMVQLAIAGSTPVSTVALGYDTPSSGSFVWGSSIPLQLINAYYTIEIEALTNGNVKLYWYKKGDPKGSPIINTTSSIFATAGTLASGKVGIRDAPTGAGGGGTLNRYWDNLHADHILPIGSDNLDITNRGNFESTPIFRIYGLIQNPIITNLATGQVIKITGTISAGDYIEIDASKPTPTVKNSSGVNLFSMVDIDKGWIKAIPGVNTLALTNLSYASGAKVVVFSKSAWL